MSETFLISRADLAPIFGQNPRVLQQFEEMQRAVSDHGDAIGANVAATSSLADATFVTLSPNAELGNEYVLSVSEGLELLTGTGGVTLQLNAPVLVGGFKAYLTAQGDTNLVLPLTGVLATQQWVTAQGFSSGGAAAWGSITGTLASQADLASALGGKQATLVSGTSIKTVNGSSLLGSGDLVVGGAAGGTSFPGSPSSGDLFYRTDRHIQYFYDGAQWLSTQLFTLELQTQDALSPFTASGNLRVANPWWNLYDIYVERFVVGYFNSSSTASNYYTTQIHKRDGTTDTAIGSGLSGQGDTQNSYVSHSEDINAVVGSSVEVLSALFTKTGTCTCHITAAFTYRLVG